MRLHGTMEINSQGHLQISGCDTEKLVKEFGTPLLVIDEAEIRKRCRDYLEAFSDTGLETETLYASKAFLNTTLCRIIEDEGLGLDVVSGGELYIAQAADFPMERVYFHGSNKTPGELSKALDAQISRFVVDNEQELLLLNQLAEDKDMVADILFRITPGVQAHTHEFIQTGQVDSKFGLSLAKGVALRVVQRAVSLPGVRVRGLHCHIGSQIFNLDSFAKAAEVMMDFSAQLRDELGLIIEELNLGGGLGVPYVEGDKEISIRDYALIVAKTIKQKSAELNLPLPKVINEPGRYITASAGTTLYTIGTIKEIPGIKTYISVDGGMTDNIRPVLYGAHYQGIIANKANDPLIQTVDIVGRCCETGDKLIDQLPVPRVESGDILAVFYTGAYTTAMSSNYNGLPRLAIILVNAGTAEVIVRRETYDDLINRDLIPERLQKNR